MQVVLNVKGSFRTTESGHNREVVALYRWPLVQVPLYMYMCTSILIYAYVDFCVTVFYTAETISGLAGKAQQGPETIEPLPQVSMYM